jgi:hypothetical protein
MSSSTADTEMTPPEGPEAELTGLHFSDSGPTLQGLQQQVNQLSGQLQQVLQLLQQNLSPQQQFQQPTGHDQQSQQPVGHPHPIQPIGVDHQFQQPVGQPHPVQQPEGQQPEGSSPRPLAPQEFPAPVPAPAPPTGNDFSSLTVKELAKQSLHLAEKQRLSGPENYQQWFQAISIQFRALQIPEFLDNPDPVSAQLSDPQKAALLLTLRNTLKEGPLSTIAFETDPAVAYKRLRLQYAPTQPILRQDLYREFHSLQFDGSITIVDFNAKFNTIVTRLRGLGVEIAEVDQINHYLNILESHFPQWAERCKGLLRREQWLYNTEGKPTRISLLYFQEDLLAEARNLASSTAHQLSVLQAGYRRSAKGKKQNSGNSSNRQEQPQVPKGTGSTSADSAGSSGSSTESGTSGKSRKQKGKKAKKTKDNAFSADEPTEAEAGDDDSHSTEPEAFTIGYNLETGTIFGNSEPEEDQEPTKSTNFNHSTSNNKQWLFDTGSTVHICTDRSLFSELRRSGNLGVVRTGGGPVSPQGVGTVKVNFFTGLSEGKAQFKPITLTETLYIPDFPLNVVSGHRLYASGGTLIKERLYSASRKLIASLDFQKSGFFFTVKGARSPDSARRPSSEAYGSTWHCYGSDLPPGINNISKEVAEVTAPVTESTTLVATPFSQTVVSDKAAVTEGASVATAASSELAAPDGAEDPEDATVSEEAAEPAVPTTALKAPSEALIQAARLWHVRLGHIGLDLLKKTALITKGMPSFQKIKPEHLACKSCDTAKILRRPSKQPVVDPPYALGRIEGDIFIIRPTPLNGRPYGLVMVDRKTRFRLLRLLKSKDEAVIAAKSTIEGLYNTYKRYPAHFHYDGGKEIRQLLPYFFEKGIGFTESSPYAHNQNGLAERSIRVILERLRAVIIASGLPPSLWGYVIGSIVEIINRTANSTKELTPYQLFLDELVPLQAPHTPDLQDYRAIGTECTVLIPPEKRSVGQKLAPRGTKGRLLAVLGHQTYLVWLGQRRIIQTSFVKLYENAAAHLQGPVSPVSPLELPDVCEDPEASTDPSGTLESTESTERPLEPFKPSRVLRPLQQPLQPLPEPHATLQPHPATVEIPLPQASKAQREEFKRVPDDDTMDTSDLVSYLATVATEKCYKAKRAKAPKNSEPTTFKQALKHPQKDRWLEGVFKEIQQLLTTRTFYFVKRSKARKKPISSRWVFKEKKNAEGKTTKFKARLVVRGFQQVPGVDFTETFAATATPPTWRIILAIAAIEDLEIEQIDFIGAFLNAGLDVEVYIEIPEGLYEFSLSGQAAVDLLKRHGWDPNEDQIILLGQSLYGLKQAPHLWQQKVATLVKGLGYKPLASDIATYFNKEDQIFIISHVDDCLLIGPSISKIKSLKQQLAKAYDIEDLGPAQYFLGVQIERNRSKRLLWLHQKAYITEAVQHFGVSTNGPETPLSPGLTASTSPSPLLNSTEKHLFQQLVGTVMYAMTQTRPDSAFSVQWLSRQLQEPTVSHLKAAKRLLSYLYGTRELALQFGSTATIAPEGYTDSDFAGCKTSARSTYGYLFTVGQGPVSWKSKRASTVAHSTLEAEFTGLIEGTKEALWLRGLYSEIQRPIQSPTPLKGDNKGAIETAYNPKHHNRTKHTLLKFQGVRECVTEGYITVTYVPTEEMPADGLTKALTPVKHRAFLALLNLHRPSPAEL